MPSTRSQITFLALGRLAIGAALVAVPRSQVGTGWVGEDAQRTPASVLIRAVGARDIALAAGMLGAQRTGSPLKPWLVGAAFADATDLVSTLAAGKAVPAQGRAAIAVLAGIGFVQQLVLARRLES
ncbi:MAG TPA: hypothetical protein VK506_06865 [Conexibacter sp.]|nr:hypothetical protein [Conexibacter sp.]